MKNKLYLDVSHYFEVDRNYSIHYFSFENWTKSHNRHKLCQTVSNRIRPKQIGWGKNEKSERERGKNELPLKWWTCFNGRWISQKSNFPSAVRLLFHSDCEICVPLFLLYYRTWNFFSSFFFSHLKFESINLMLLCVSYWIPTIKKKERRSFASAVWIDWKSLIKHHTVQKEAVTKQ